MVAASLFSVSIKGIISCVLNDLVDLYSNNYIIHLQFL